MSDPLLRLPEKIAGRCAPLPESVPYAGGLWFPRLSADSSRELRGFATLGWYIPDDRDVWSKLFLDFKQAQGNSVAGAAAVMGSMLERVDWPHYGEIAIVSAMSSDQMTYDPAKPQAQLARRLAERLKFRHLEGVLRKKAHGKMHSMKNADEREKAIDGTYELIAKVPGNVVLICDDMMTGGNTLGEIARAIRVKHPDIEIVGIGLGKSERAAWAAKFDKKLNNQHLGAARLKEWQRAS